MSCSRAALEKGIMILQRLGEYYIDRTIIFLESSVEKNAEMSMKIDEVD